MRVVGNEAPWSNPEPSIASPQNAVEYTRTLKLETRNPPPNPHAFLLSRSTVDAQSWTGCIR